MNVEMAGKIILRPHVTEKVFDMVEKEKKLCFIVQTSANKPQIAQAITTLYHEKVVNVNTARTIYGKKAFIELETVEKARDLATNIGMV